MTARDAEALRDAAHTLKGGGANLSTVSQTDLHRGQIHDECVNVLLAAADFFTERRRGPQRWSGSQYAGRDSEAGGRNAAALT